MRFVTELKFEFSHETGRDWYDHENSCKRTRIISTFVLVLPYLRNLYLDVSALSLSGESRRQPGPLWSKFDMLFPSNHQLSSLTNLTLRGCCVQPKELEKFLKSHSANLQTIAFEDIGFGIIDAQGFHSTGLSHFLKETAICSWRVK